MKMFHMKHQPLHISGGVWFRALVPETRVAYIKENIAALKGQIESLACIDHAFVMSDIS